MLMLVGCTKATDRVGLEGTVTLDSQPLVKGDILFRPSRETRGPTAGGKIIDGLFVVSPKKGPFAGEFQVEITATRKTGGKVTTLFGDTVDEEEQYIPVRYNESDLTADVTNTGPNEFKFVLKSH